MVFGLWLSNLTLIQWESFWKGLAVSQNLHVQWIGYLYLINDHWCVIGGHPGTTDQRSPNLTWIEFLLLFVYKPLLVLGLLMKKPDKDYFSQFSFERDLFIQITCNFKWSPKRSNANAKDLDPHQQADAGLIMEKFRSSTCLITHFISELRWRVNLINNKRRGVK